MRVIMQQSSKNTFLKFMPFVDMRFLDWSLLFILLHLVFEHFLRISIISHPLRILISVQMAEDIIFHISEFLCHFPVLIIFMHQLRMFVIKPHILCMFPFYLFVVSQAILFHLCHPSHVILLRFSLMLHDLSFVLSPHLIIISQVHFLRICSFIFVIWSPPSVCRSFTDPCRRYCQ